MPVCFRAKRLALQLTLLKHNRLLAISFLVFIIWFSCLTMWSWLYKSSEYEFEVMLSTTDFNVILSTLPERSVAGSSKCISPNLPLYNDFIRNNRPPRIPSDLCDKSRYPNWLQVSQSRILFKQEFASATCTAQPIVRMDDDTSEFASAQPIHNNSELPSMGFRALCTASDGTHHSSVYYGIKRMQSVTSAAQHTTTVPDNIIIVGLDSLSRLESLRSLPIASDVVKSKLNGVTLQQYNILGDGTPAALLPILTGVTEEEMPEGRKGMKSARHVDESMRWIFQDLKDQGYVTMWGEEESGIGSFQMRFLGFKREPVDYYLRPVLIKQEPLQTDGICIGNEISSARMLQAVQDLFYLHPNQPKFSFAYFVSLSHENKDLSLMDSELSKFFEWFVREDLIRNTTLILMSDHGQRHGAMRNSMQGKLEESLPLFTFALSRQLTSQHKSALQMLHTNANRLTTPVDIYKTLLSVAGVRNSRAEKEERITSYSLIDQTVPESRSCSDAGIPTHWCSCLRLMKLANPDSQQLSLRAARFVVREMNMATHSFRHLCHELQLHSVIESAVSLADLDFVRREKRVNFHSGMAFNVENKELVGAGFVNLRFSTTPNTGMYEATVQFSLLDTSRTLALKLNGEASRINRYGSQAECVRSTAPRLRKFCHCSTK